MHTWIGRDVWRRGRVARRRVHGGRRNRDGDCKCRLQNVDYQLVIELRLTVICLRRGSDTSARASSSVTQVLRLVTKRYSLFKHGSYTDKLPSAGDRPLSLSIMLGINDKHRIYLAFYPRAPGTNGALHFHPGILVVPRTPWLHRLRATPLKRATLYHITKDNTETFHFQTDKIRPYRYNCIGLVLLGHLPSRFTEDDVSAYLSEVPLVQNDPFWENANWAIDAIQVFAPSRVSGL
jgi:hypothetical protein